jgi:hypothetical protein
VAAVSGDLEIMATYASLDAGTFPQCIAPGKEREVREKSETAKKKAEYMPTAGTGMTGNSMTPDSEWNETRLKFAYQQVKGLKAGICTSFAKAAAYVLVKGRSSGPRIEIVAAPAHVFVIVGRTGGYAPGRKLPSTSTWGNAIVVDVWMKTMGHSAWLYAPGGNGFSTDLQIIMERPAS